MLKNQEVSAVVFDLGGVLIDWNPEYLYRDLIPDRTERVAFLESVCTAEWNHSMDAGRSVPDAVAALARKHPDKTDLINAWWERWPEMLGGHHAEVLDTARLLSDGGVTLYALTNWAAETWPHAVERFPFLTTLFDGVLVSGKEGLAKPDPAIFRLLLNRYELDQRRTAFVDDSMANIEAAFELGFLTHYYTGPEELREWLVEHQLIDRGSS